MSTSCIIIILGLSLIKLRKQPIAAVDIFSCSGNLERKCIEGVADLPGTDRLRSAGRLWWEGLFEWNLWLALLWSVPLLADSHHDDRWV